jgi:hypothetical protein
VPQSLALAIAIDSRFPSQIVVLGNNLGGFGKHMGGRVATVEAMDTSDIARYLEPFALAMAQLAYERDSGPEIAYRIEHFKSRG